MLISGFSNENGRGKDFLLWFLHTLGITRKYGCFINGDGIILNAQQKCSWFQNRVKLHVEQNPNRA